LLKKNQDLELELARYLLPSDILEYFDLVSHNSTEEQIHFYLEEKT